MRITMNIEDDQASPPEVNVTTSGAMSTTAADHGELIDAGPPMIDRASLPPDQGGVEENDHADVDASSPNVMSNGADVGGLTDMNDGGAAPTSISDNSDDWLLH